MSASRVMATSYFARLRRARSSRAMSSVISFSHTPWARAPESFPPCPGSSTSFLTPRDAVTGPIAFGARKVRTAGAVASTAARSGALPDRGL